MNVTLGMKTVEKMIPVLHEVLIPTKLAELAKNIDEKKIPTGFALESFVEYISFIEHKYLDEINETDFAELKKKFIIAVNETLDEYYNKNNCD